MVWRGKSTAAWALALLAAAGGARVWAQAPAAPPAPAAVADDAGGGSGSNAAAAPETFFPHGNGRWFVAGQINYIYQEHGAFPAAYSGPNSLIDRPEDALSRVLTLYTGLELNGSTEVLVDVEETGGQGLSTVLGLAGFTNLDAVRNPELSTAPYLSRWMIHKVMGFGQGRVAAAPGPLSTFSSLPKRRIELRVGKFSLPDFFDVNTAGSDSHLQFMNWTIDNNGAYDYAADTRGYTEGAMIEYQSPAWGARFAETLMPTVANGLQLQTNLGLAHASNAEVEWHPEGWRFPTIVRLLGYENVANMGEYRQAIDAYLGGETPRPEITNHPLEARAKPGMGINFETALTPGVHVFGRLGLASGKYESFAYTEAEQSLSYGATVAGGYWHRSQDKAGVAMVINGISGDHRRYLQLGGLGFLLGDGGLTYGHETIEEGFYNVPLGHGLNISPDAQYIVNPGYNQVRGPVLVTSARFHVDF